MPTFIDESGDVGPDEGCARYFRLAAAWFEAREHVDQYIHEITSLRARLNVKHTLEFHFARISHQRRMAFFEAISEIPFGVALCAIEKHTYSRSELSKDWIRQTAVEGLVSILEETYLIAEGRRPGESGLNEPVRYDQCNDRGYEKLLKARFRSLASGRGSNKKLVGDVKPGKSKVDSCIQLADMVCGAIGRHIEGDNTYYDLIRNKLIGITVYQKE